MRNAGGEAPRPRRDFDGNGNADILWRDSGTGTVAIWLMNGLQILQTATVGAVPGTWSVAETGDFDQP